jgi:O-acetyl-ADP-ribose deacetylase (regulator of RNase III)
MKHIKGNLLDELEQGNVQAIGHCCNCQRTMGSGIALQLKKRWPEVYEADLNYMALPADRLGNISIADLDTDQVVYNLYGQLFYGSGKREVSYEGIYAALKKMRNDCYVRGLIKVGFPLLMASDRAGGDWRIIAKMIEVLFEEPNSNFQVTIVEYDA